MKKLSKSIVFSLLLTGLVVGVSLVYQRFVFAQANQEVVESQSIFREQIARGRVVELDDPEWRRNVSVRELVNESRVIAIGVPIRNACHQSQNGQVATDYQVRLQEVIKGNIQQNSIVAVSMPGGLVTENDRSITEFRSRRIRRMQNEKTYLMFLKNAHGETASFAPLRGSQGLYEIRPNSPRLFHMGRSFDLPPSDDGEDAGVFLQQIRDLVRRR